MSMWEKAFACYLSQATYFVAFSTELYNNWAALWVNKRMEGEKGSEGAAKLGVG